MKLFVNLFCRDIAAQLAFYGQLLDMPEATHSRSPIYRAIETPGFQFGFHARAAYGLLGLDERQPAEFAGAPVTAYATFMLATPAAVDEAAGRVGALGGRVIRPPYPTYYREWQAVLADPEDHVFRVSCAALPPGAVPPPVPA